MSQLAEGVVSSADKGSVVFSPAGTNYQLHLQAGTDVVTGPTTKGVITVKARKVWTIPAGGSFMQPLVGSPRVVQGRVKAVEGGRLIVQAGTVVSVQLPADPTALDLKNGPLVPGVMVNITTFPDAGFALAR